MAIVGYIERGAVYCTDCSHGYAEANITLADAGERFCVDCQCLLTDQEVTRIEEGGKFYLVTVLETVRSTYRVEATDSDDARSQWYDEGDECGPLMWSDCKDAHIEAVEEDANGQA